MFGVGARVLAEPPVATVYQRRLLPVPAVALRALVLWFWHRFNGLVTPGADGVGLTFTVIEARGLSHPLPFAWLTYQVFEPAVAVDGVGAVVE